MELISSISDFVDNKVNKTGDLVDRIVKDPSLSGKTLQVVINVFSAVDLARGGKILDRPVTQAMKDVGSLLGFYGTFRNVIFWINPFSYKTLDKKVFFNSLESSLSTYDIIDAQVPSSTIHDIALDIFEKVEKQKHSTKSELREFVIIELQSAGYSTQTAYDIAQQILIQNQPRSAIQIVIKVCFTALGVGGNLMTLDKWGILDLGKLAAQIGSQSNILAVVVSVGSKTVLGTLATTGLTLSFGYNSYLLIKSGIKLYHAEKEEEKKLARQELKNHLIDTGLIALDLTACALPLLFVLNPPVVVGLSLVAKGTGLVCALVRK